MRKFYNLMLFIALLCAMESPAIAGETAYGYLFGDMTGQKGFVSFDVDAPQKLTILKNTQYDEIHVSAGEYVDGKIYTYRLNVNDMFSSATAYDWAVYDAATLKELATVNMEGTRRVVDMTYDYTSNTMYALVEDKQASGSVSKSSLCIVDMKTGKYTLVGNPGKITAVDGYGRPTDDKLLTLACDNKGTLYAMSHYRTLYALDKMTGLATAAAPQHNLSTINQLQSMAFDANGDLWWAQSHPDYGFFCKVDLKTGIPGGFVDFKTDYDKLNKLGSDGQLTSLYFTSKKVNAKALTAVSSLESATLAEDCNSVVLTWKAPTTDYSGNAAQVAGYKVYRIGSSEALATLAADAVSFTDSKAPNATITYEVIPFNADGNGFPAFTEIFAGYDMLDVVNDVKVALDDKTVTLSWTKPTKTVNGGYANFDAITYNVYRAQGTAEELVASAISETTFSETLEKAGGYKYIIEAVSGSVVGKRAMSEQFLITTIAAIPYFTGFEDSQDGALWSFINNSAKGWSILSDYSKFDGKYAKAATGGSTALGNDWLISPAIDFEKGNYKIEFYACGSSYDKNSVDFLLGTDKANVESFTFPVFTIVDENVYDATATPKGWKLYSAKFSVTDKGIYHLGIHNKTTATFANFRVDNLSIVSDGSGIDGVVAGENSVKVVANANSIAVKADKDIDNVEIYDMQGRCIASRAFSSNDAVVSGLSLAKGIYLVSVVFNDGTKTVAKIAQ
ncbi:MAG: T9SS type A sorting domain-containing protein [Muribaculaceae bacterium]|nr:T9SS type A sorting domain-containing protein [Muribaculaceae bacterium]